MREDDGLRVAARRRPRRARPAQDGRLRRRATACGEDEQRLLMSRDDSTVDRGEVKRAARYNRGVDASHLASATAPSTCACATSSASRAAASRRPRRTCSSRSEHEGRVGLGEAAPILRYGEDRRLGGAGGGRRWRRAWATRARSRWPRARAAVAGQASAEAAVDMALHDLAGQRLRRAAVRDARASTRGRRRRRRSRSAWTRPRWWSQKVREAADYPILKVKMGSDDDREVLQAVRDTTDRPLRVDANEGWTPAERAGAAGVAGPPRRRARGAAAARGHDRGDARAAARRARCPSTPTRACTAPRTSRAWRAPSTASTSSS